LTHVKVIY